MSRFMRKKCSATAQNRGGVGVQPIRAMLLFRLGFFQRASLNVLRKAYVQRFFFEQIYIYTWYILFPLAPAPPHHYLSPRCLGVWLLLQSPRLCLLLYIYIYIFSLPVFVFSFSTSTFYVLDCGMTSGSKLDGTNQFKNPEKHPYCINSEVFPHCYFRSFHILIVWATVTNCQGSVGQTPHHRPAKTVFSTVLSNSEWQKCEPVELRAGWREAQLASISASHSCK